MKRLLFKRVASVLVSILVFILSGCVEKQGAIGQQLHQLLAEKNQTSLTQKELVALLAGSTIRGESEKTRDMRGTFSQKFEADGSWVFTFYKSISQAPKHSFYGKWLVLADGSLCTQKYKDATPYCNRKIYRSRTGYYTVNTETNKVWAEWTVDTSK